MITGGQKLFGIVNNIPFTERKKAQVNRSVEDIAEIVPFCFFTILSGPKQLDLRA